MNKPVAWVYRVNNSFNTFSTIEPPDDAYDEGTLVPLYTHPVKELSGVEIIGMSGKYDFTYEVDIIDFVRACLRKAQEK